MKKFISIIAICLVLILTMTACNKQIIDLNYTFNYAYVELPGGTWVEGKVDSWTDYEDGDQIQVKIDGVTYLAHSSRIILVHK